MKRMHLSRAHETFTDIDHLLGDKDNLNKSPKVEKNIKSILWLCKIKLEINT